jgi:hypothetical protein
VAPDGLAKEIEMRTVYILILLIVALNAARSEDTSAPSRIDSITKSARDMMPAMPSMPSVSFPSMPDLSLPDFSETTGRLMTEFNTFTQQVGDALPILEQMGYEVTTFKVTWGLPPKARLRLKSTGNADIQKVNAIAEGDKRWCIGFCANRERRDGETYSKHDETRDGVSRRRLCGSTPSLHEVRWPEGKRKR